jgi:hypothetical protein
MTLFSFLFLFLFFFSFRAQPVSFLLLFLLSPQPSFLSLQFSFSSRDASISFYFFISAGPLSLFWFLLFGLFPCPSVMDRRRRAWLLVVRLSDGNGAGWAEHGGTAVAGIGFGLRSPALES